SGKERSVDYFGRQDFRDLLEEEEGPAVSIYVPTERTSSEAETNRLRYRAALDRARELLGSAPGSNGAGDGLMEELEPLTREEEFWRYQSDGLAVFAAPGFQRLYRLPSRLPELVVVGPTFHTRPMLEYLQAPDRYWVLGLSQKKVRLWSGTAAGVSPIDLKGVPRNLMEALGYEFERDEKLVMRRKTRNASHGSHGRGGVMPVFHGHGVGTDDAEPELRRFFRAVDAGLQEMLEGEIGPLVLAAVSEYHPLYRDVSRLDNLADEGIEASVVDWNPDRVHEAAWPIAKAQVLKKIDRALELWENAYGSGKGEMDLANLGRLVIAGRMRLLLTERDRRIWGRIDRTTGEIDVVREGGDDPSGDAVELLDELAELTILRGGNALVLPPERMPTDTGIAGILR
ncbi:MAG TPA: hypothetical protein VKA44_06505, partial [Gemmatimonadota bacterium]|nr:hypothetical protein [Gemmatimonadota bacterium]